MEAKEPLNILDYYNKDVYVVGDIHGDFPYFFNRVFDTKATDILFLLAGDIGFGFDRENYYTTMYNKFSKKLNKFNIDVLAVRGNHDDPSYFDGKRFNKPRFKCVPDYTVIRVWNEPSKTLYNGFLMVGGGTSIDRTMRIKTNDKYTLERLKYNPNSDYIKRCYWENEQPVYDENKLQLINDENILIHHVITHTAPSFCPPTDKRGVEYWAAFDATLYDDIDRERSEMDKLYDGLKKFLNPLKTWTYGHFHKHDSLFYDNIEFTLLNCLQNGFDTKCIVRKDVEE